MLNHNFLTKTEKNVKSMVRERCSIKKKIWWEKDITYAPFLISGVHIFFVNIRGVHMSCEGEPVQIVSGLVCKQNWAYSFFWLFRFISLKK